MSLVRVGLDFNCNPRLVGALNALYGHRGFQFLHMETLVPGRTDDDIWADAFKKFGGRVVLSGDCKIAYKPHLAVAFIDNGFVSFFPGGAWARLKGHMRSALLIHSWPRIEEKVAEGTSVLGTCWRIHSEFANDELKIGSAPFERLEIPDDVLDKARQEKASGQKR